MQTVYSRGVFALLWQWSVFPSGVSIGGMSCVCLCRGCCGLVEIPCVCAAAAVASLCVAGCLATFAAHRVSHTASCHAPAAEAYMVCNVMLCFETVCTGRAVRRNNVYCHAVR
jgi:hypothetical protein